MESRIDHPKKGDRLQDKEVILITGSSGLIGFNLIERLAPQYRLVGLDRVGPPYPPLKAECVNFDITDEEAIASAMERIRYGYGSHIASVIHLAAFYSFDSQYDEKYKAINVEGTRKFLEQLQDFQVDQFIFSSTDLLYQPTEPGHKIDESAPVEKSWGYPDSKIETEQLIKENHNEMPVAILRIAGVYTDYGHSIPITHQIKRIYEKDLKSHLYSGNLNHGDVYVHLDDVLRAIHKTVEKRKELPPEITINIGEPATPTYQQLQDTIGNLIHGEDWDTHKIPKPLAKAGAFAQNVVSDTFIKPWMIERAGEHYELDIARAKKVLDWEPEHSILDTLPKMIASLKENPKEWYERNNLN